MLALSFGSQAALLIEPYAGVNVNAGWSDDSFESTSQLSGTMYGARVGVQSFGFMTGLDARKGAWSVDDEDDTEIDYTHYAVFAGYDFPILLRVYAEYILGGSGIDQDDNTFIQPSGFVFGAGYKFFPYLSANLEFGNVDYKEVELADGTNLEDREEGAKYFLLSLSIPFTLGL